MHPEAEEPTRRAHFRSFLSAEILAANWRRFRRSPAGYLRLWFEVLRHALGSANFFFGAIGILPKTVLFAEDMQHRGVRHVHAHFANHPALAALIVAALAVEPKITSVENRTSATLIDAIRTVQALPMA